ncbi:hypothetical protein FHS75_001335 [Novosphingobium marinum]|uniref:Transglycosylase SLT domain-containing protein n=1 Tax=Novosphingobium marinum TaxID=1514948 RepID=A0A7Z0BSK4_9SPHN|nr:lytic transglycosylase domain-containing protein [Novosphingobium marinum]NYH95016.1 hypothetical protein [Novosphingobium marinum]
MSQTPQILPAAHADATSVRASIARASQATGVDFDYLLAQAKLESGLDPEARAPTSSATGLYQFTNGTWLETLDRHGSRHGLGWADQAIAGGRIADRAIRAQVMALRNDPDASALMAAELANDNRASLTGVLGREPDAAELYLAHFLGAGGAGKFLSVLAVDPQRSAASLLPRAAAANRSIFFDKAGEARSVAAMMDLMRAKVSGAMEHGGEERFEAFGFRAADGPARSHVATGPVAREFHAARAEAPAVSRRSMAQTLAGAFGDPGGNGAAPASVRAAYARLARFGL